VAKFISDKEMEMLQPAGRSGRFISDEEMGKISSPKPKESVGETAIMQGLAGASGQFLDEASGAVEAAGRAVGLEGLGGSFSDIGLAEGGPTIDKDTLWQAYEQARDKKRGILAKQASDNPATATVANIGGAIVSPINKVAKGMSAAKAGAALGGINAFGGSDADNALGLAKDTAIGVGLGAAAGKGVEKLQGALSARAAKAVNAIEPARQKRDAALIREAAERLNIKVTPGMLDDTGFVERLESSLAKSPSMFGRSVARNQKAVTDRMSGAVDDLTSEATNLSPYQVGEKFKSGVTAKVGERLDPIKTVFNEVAESTKSIPISEKSVKAVTRNIENLDTYALTGGAGKPGQYVEMIGRLKNADQVKTMMTLLNKDIQAAQGSERQVLIGIKEKLSSLEKNSIMRSAIQGAREGGMRKSTGEVIGKEIVGDLKDARKGYATLSKDLGEVAESARIKTGKGPSAFLDDVESIPSERVQDKFFNIENNRQLMSLRDKFPEEFNLLRQGKLREIQERVVDNSANGQGAVSASRFLKEVRGLNEEASQMLFPGKGQTISDMQTVQNSLPRNFNPSGTASEAGWQEAVYKNIKDIPTYALYRVASTNLAKNVTERLARTPELAQIYRSNPLAFQNTTEQALSSMGLIGGGRKAIPRASGDDRETGGPNLKGPDKWAADGIAKLEEHSGESISMKILANPKAKNLLIAASDAKPGSKAMNSILSQLKSKYGEAK
jgi:hypothetical protein